MAKQFRQVRSDDALTIIVQGDKRNPEPSHLIIKLPGGTVEVARCSDGSYWVHTHATAAANVVGGRIEYEHGAARAVTTLPDADKVVKLAMRLEANVTNPEDAAA